MTDMQPYVAKVDDWVNFYANADKKRENVAIGGGVSNGSGEPVARVETKPHYTMSAPTSSSVPVISPTQEVVNQSIAKLKRKRKGRHKHGHSKKRKVVRKRTGSRKRRSVGKRRGKRSNKLKHKGKKRVKPKKKRKAKRKRKTKRKTKTKKRSDSKQKHKKRKSKKTTERDLYPTII
jgi:hypothetical protein